MQFPAEKLANSECGERWLITELFSEDIPICRRENSLLFLLLMLGTLWLATTLYNFNQTPYLQANIKQIGSVQKVDKRL